MSAPPRVLVEGYVRRAAPEITPGAGIVRLRATNDAYAPIVFEGHVHEGLPTAQTAMLHEDLVVVELTPYWRRVLRKGRL